MIVDKHRFTSGALTVRDFLVALGKTVDRSQLRCVIQRLEGPEAASMMRQMELDLPMDGAWRSCPFWTITGSAFFGCGSGKRSFWSWTG